MLKYGDTITSPGGLFTYRVIGPVCRLYDREELPWPSCAIQWHGKQPSWNRVGRRFVSDMASKRSASYAVIDETGTVIVHTFFDKRLTKEGQSWWYTRGSAQVNQWWDTEASPPKELIEHKEPDPLAILNPGREELTHRLKANEKPQAPIEVLYARALAKKTA